MSVTESITELPIERAEGTRFSVSLARADRADAPVVVVAPAMGMKARYYLDLVTALAAAGVHGAVAEQRGHEAAGGRVPGRDYDYGYAELVEDLGDALGAVRRELPEAPVVVLGHSLGGQVAAAYAGERAGGIDGLVFFAASTPHWRHWGPKLLLAGYGFPLAARLVGHFPGQQLRFAGREARRLLREWGGLARTGVFPLGERGLERVAVPVLAVSIEGDTLGPVAAVDALTAKLPSAAVTRIHLDAEGVDHFRWARRPDVAVPIILDWLRASGLSR